MLYCSQTREKKLKKNIKKSYKSPKIKELGDALVNLTVKEVSELADYLKEEHGIEPAAAAVAVAGPAAGGDAGGGCGRAGNRSRSRSRHSRRDADCPTAWCQEDRYLHPSPR